MNRISFDDKVDARILGGARINKVIADDMNQIKTAINILVDSGADLPQFSTAARDLITPAPVLGYRIYNTTENRGEYYTSGGWLPWMGLKDVHAGGSPNFPSALRGDILRITANGRLGGVSGLSVFAGDLVYCYVANAGGTYASVGSNFKRIGLPPSLTTAQINALTQPQEVGLVYDTDLNVMKFYNGVLWLAMVAMFFGDEYEVFASTPTAGQLFYATDTYDLYYGDGITHRRVNTAESCACIKTVKVTLSSAQILSSHTTPIELIAAPGAGKLIKVLGITGKLSFSTAAYVLGADCYLAYQDNLSSGYISSAEMTTYVTLANTNYFGVALVNFTLANAENKSVFFYTESSDPTTGDSTIDLYITYQILTL